MISTIFDHNSTATLISFVITSVAVVLLIIALILSLLKKTNKKIIIQMSIIAIIVYGIGFIFNTYQSQENSRVMLDKIETNTKVSDLKILDGELLSCENDFKGSLNAATWKTNDKYHVGVLIGKSEKDKCVYNLAETSSINN